MTSGRQSVSSEASEFKLTRRGLVCRNLTNGRVNAKGRSLGFLGTLFSLLMVFVPVIFDAGRRQMCFNFGGYLIKVQFLQGTTRDSN